MTPSLCFVIPAKNEQKSVARVLSGLRQLHPGALILVVDDASEDDTRQVALRAGATVLPLCSSLGAWGATQTGIRYAAKLGFDQVITLDADGQHPPEMVNRLLQTARISCANVIIGSCPSRGSKLRKIAWMLMRRTSGINIADLTSGFRLYDSHAVHIAAGINASYLEHQDIGVLALLLSKRMTIADTKVEMLERQDGSSRIFSSWLKVLVFMVHTLLLGLSKRSLPNKRVKEPARD